MMLRGPATIAVLLLLGFVSVNAQVADPDALHILWAGNNPPSSLIVSSLESNNRFLTAYVPRIKIDVYVALKADNTNAIYEQYCLNEINYPVGGSTRSCDTRVTIKFANGETLSFDSNFKQGSLTAVNELRRILDEDRLINGEAWTVNALSEALQTAGTIEISIVGTILPTKKFTITANPDTPTAITWAANPSGTLEAGVNSQLSAAMVDSYSNIATNAGSSSLTVTPDSGDPFSISLVNGQGTTQFSRTLPQVVVLTPKHSSLQDISPSTITLTFTPGSTRQVLTTVDKTQTPEGSDVVVTVTAKDAFDNINTAENRKVALVDTNNNNYGTITMSNGVGSATFTQVASVVTLKLTPIDNFASNVKFFPTDGVQVTFTAVCDGVTGYQDEEGAITCKDIRGQCEAGSFESRAPSSSNNRECTACDGVTEYQDEPNQQSCKSLADDCVPGQYVQVQPSPSVNRVCDACDGVTTYSNSVNSPVCINITSCVSGEHEVSPPTTSTDRQCDKCKIGFHDHDSSGLTACEPCNRVLVAQANFSTDTDSAYLTFTQEFNKSTTVTSLGGATITGYTLLSGGCRSDIEVFPPIMALIPGISSTVFSLIGESSVYGRGIAVTYSDGSTGCAEVDTWVSAPPSFTNQPGLTQCTNYSQCDAGSRTVSMSTHTADQQCTACNGVTEYQDLDDSRFCAVVRTCTDGFKTVVNPSPTTNRECGDVTCPGLDPPRFGSITNCNGTDKVEPYLQQCQYSCDGVGFIPVNTIRTCQQNGLFDGIAPVCECDGTLALDTVNGECVSACPAGSIKRNGERECTKCTEPCGTGFFESQPCDPQTNTDRQCTACRTCEDGSWSISGCFPNNNTDTICVPFTACADGYYETVPGTPVSDRECSLCRACDANLGLFQASGCCGTVDSVCDSLTTCPEGTFEYAPPQEAVQGGFNYDRVCQKFTTCGANQYLAREGNATHDNVCESCSECESGSYQTEACSTNADVSCTPYKICPQGFVQRGGSAYTDVHCESCSTCESTLEWQVSACNSINDTVCKPLTKCDPVTEFESASATISSDRECSTCDTCEGGVVTTACDATSNTVCDYNLTTAVEDCPRGTVSYGVSPFTICVACSACEDGTFAEGGMYCRDDPVRLAYSPRCSNWSTCPEGFVSVEDPTSTSDRVCVRCARCAPGSYPVNASDCVASTEDLECFADEECAEDEYETSPSSSISPRECAKCTQCGDDEYEIRACGEMIDAICGKVSTCPFDMHVLSPATATSDTVCVGCDNVVIAVPVADPFLCPAPYPEEKCQVAPVSPPEYTEPYSIVSFTMPFDFSIIASNPLYTHRVAFFEEEVQSYIESELQLPSENRVRDLAVAPGSIVVTFKITGPQPGPDSNETSHEDAAASAQQWLSSGSFSFSFEGNALTLDAESVTVQRFDPLSTSSPTPQPTLSPVVPTTVPVPTTTTSATDAPTTEENVTSNITETTTVVTDVEESSGNDEFPVGGIVGIVVVGFVVLVFGIFLIARYSREQEKRKNSGLVTSNPTFSKDGTVTSEDDYLNLHPDTDVTFDGELSEENKKLQAEVNNMQAKIAQKNAIISEQHRSQRMAQQTLEVAITAKLRKENEALQAEIAAMKNDLRRKRQNSKFQKAAAFQAQLKAEKLALEQEIVQSDNVAQIALEALSEYDTLQANMEQEENEARTAEMERIQAEKERLATEMNKLSQRLDSIH